MLTEILFYLAENNTFYVRDLETNFNFLIKLLSLRYRLICTFKNNTEIPCITYSVIPVIADWKTLVQRHNQDTDADILAFKEQSIPSAAKVLCPLIVIFTSLSVSPSLLPQSITDLFSTSIVFLF